MVDLKALIDQHVGGRYGKKPTSLPNRVDSTQDKSPVQLEKEREEEARRLKEQQDKDGKPATVQKSDSKAAAPGHPAVRTTLPPSTYMPPKPGSLAPKTSEQQARAATHTGAKPRFRDVVEVGARILGVDLDNLLGDCRARAVALPRHMITYFLVRCTDCTLGEACDAVGYQYKGTISYSVKNIENILRYGPRKDLEVQLLVGLKKLCEHFNKQLPDSRHWPQEESLADTHIQEEDASADTIAD